MLFNNINIEEKLMAARTASGPLQYAQSILNDQGHTHEFTAVNKLYTNALETSRIYHIRTIQKICVDYRLRFLDRKYYKMDIPEEAQLQIDHIESSHQTVLHSFKIIAPAKALKLKNADDPLLFVPIGNDYYYLVHKWGNNLNALRKWRVLPFKNLGTMILSILIMSLLTTFLIPFKSYGHENYNTIKLISFLFIFKSYCAILLYYCFWKGKNFSIYNWNSEYYN
ncbi:hypothetical protein [Flavobacterium humi]|uniref:Uncharacterized protein n=1 Tax=Flavobacterium humi TaxID=2562683 RepID=A0A4Z0LCV8_9FLAO|nr:hypothetical protein [Flavobacterium humi]TGD59708.1 hypothetical protein E4635_01875 [Flavobacterium humi]